MQFTNLKGSITAMVTPFTADGSAVDFDALTVTIERQIAGGTGALLVLGTTGEYPTMSQEENDAVVRHTIATVAGRVPVIAGSGSNSTAHQIELSKRYEAMGADALLIISPYYNKANCQGMIRHFASTADAVSIPCILYNVPGRTGCSIPVEAVEVLAKHPNICGIKEASGNMSYAMQIAHLVGDDFAMWSGNDDIIVPMLAAGASGVISVFSNVCPEAAHDIVAAWHAGNTAEALRLQTEWLDLMNDLFMEVNPIPVKTAMGLLGVCSGTLRLPLCEMTPEHTERLRAVMARHGLL